MAGGRGHGVAVSKRAIPPRFPGVTAAGPFSKHFLIGGIALGVAGTKKLPAGREPNRERWRRERVDSVAAAAGGTGPVDVAAGGDHGGGGALAGGIDVADDLFEGGGDGGASGSEGVDAEVLDGVEDEFADAGFGVAAFPVKFLESCFDLGTGSAVAVAGFGEDGEGVFETLVSFDDGVDARGVEIGVEGAEDFVVVFVHVWMLVGFGLPGGRLVERVGKW